jgi:nucleotide-binding universal stress UspA family protein
MAIPSESRSEIAVLRRILVATDGSKLSAKAVNAAIELAKVFHARLVALYVFPKFPGVPYGTFGPAEDVLEQAHERQGTTQADQVFADIRKQADAAGVDLDSTFVVSNEVWKEVIAVAKRKKCDLICMASHGRRGLAGLVLGSETQKVLTHSTLPVLVLR